MIPALPMKWYVLVEGKLVVNVYCKLRQHQKSFTSMLKEERKWNTQDQKKFKKEGKAK